MTQLFELCNEQVSTKVLLRYKNKANDYEQIMCSAFGDIVNQLANKPKESTVTIEWKANISRTLSHRSEDHYLCSERVVISY